MSAQILVVDLNIGHRTQLSEVLNSEGHSVVEALSFDDIWKDLKDQHSFDLIITSIDVPGYTVADYVDRLKRNYPKTPVVIVTEKKKMAAFKECAEVGGDDYMTLPLDSKNVINVVSRVIELNRPKRNVR